jgi:hypothetical protein
MKTSFFTIFFFGVAVAACADGSDLPGGEGGAGGEEVVTSNNSSSSSSGMGGAGGNGSGGMGGMGGMGGGGPAVTAEHLGQLCTLTTPCPMGYSCAVTSMGATSGMCTLPCGGQMDATTCANGFPGPGQPVCAMATDQMGNMANLCAILCGTNFNLPETCPTGLTCQDKFNPTTGMPVTDGKTDSCVP